MDDLRIEWLCGRVLDSLDVHWKDAFEELLSHDNGHAELLISDYLNETTEDTHRPLIFYKLVLEQDEEIEVDCGRSKCFLLRNILHCGSVDQNPHIYVF